MHPSQYALHAELFVSLKQHQHFQLLFFVQFFDQLKIPLLQSIAIVRQGRSDFSIKSSSAIMLIYLTQNFGKQLLFCPGDVSVYR